MKEPAIDTQTHDTTPAGFRLTNHAAVRIQQRGIPPWYLRLLLEHGKSTHDGHGAVLKSVTKATRQRLFDAFVGVEPLEATNAAGQKSHRRKGKLLIDQGQDQAQPWRTPERERQMFTHSLEHEHQNELFKRRTGVQANKSQELLTAIILQRWLRQSPPPLPGVSGARLRTEQTGPDATLVGEFEGERGVEFKCARRRGAGGGSSFQFKAGFKFEDYGLVVLMKLVSGIPRRMFIIRGAEAMRGLRQCLDLDMKRPSYKSDRPPLLYTTRRAWTVPNALPDGERVRVESIRELKGRIAGAVEVLESAELHALCPEIQVVQDTLGL